MAIFYTDSGSLSQATITNINASGSFTGSSFGSFNGSFVGDGSGLTGVTAEGDTGVQIRDDGTPTGTATILNFADGLDVSGTTTASISLDRTGSFDGTFTGDGSGLTGVVSSSYAATASLLLGSIVSSSYSLTSSYSNTSEWDGLNNIPSGLVSSSTQITITESQISDLTHYTDTDTLDYINTVGVFSSSAQVNADSVTNFDSNVLTYINSLGTVSSSIQIDHDQTTNYSADEHFTQANITAVGTVTSGNINAILPSGTVSSSAQIDHDQTTNYSADEHFTQANITTVGTVTSGDVSAILPSGTVSSSAQITITESQISDLTHYTDTDTLDYINTVGVFSSSAQVTITESQISDLTHYTDTDTLDYINSVGVFSSSAQVNADTVTNFDSNVLTYINSLGAISSSTQVDYGSIQNVPSGIVSASSFTSPSQGTVRATINGVQTDVDTGLQTGDSPQFTNLTLSGNLTVNGTTTYISSSQVDIGDQIITLNANNASGDGGIYVNDTSTNETGSLLWDVSENYWIGGLLGSESEIITLTSLNAKGVFSSSAQVNADSVTNFDSNVLTYINSLGAVSSSSQIDHDQTTNYSADEHFTQANITTLGTVTSGNINAILPSGTVSSSTQITITESQISDLTHYTDTDTLDYINSVGVISSSAQVNADSVTNFDSNVLAYINTLGAISSSSQITITESQISDLTHYTDTDTLDYINTVGVFSSSAQVDFDSVSNVPNGLVSSSSQIDHDQTTNFSADEHFTQANITTVGTVTSGNINAILPSGTVSSSAQITITESQISDLTHYTDTDTLDYINTVGVFSSSAQVNADTVTNFDSNVLTYINSLGTVSASSQIDHDQTTNFSADEHFTQANITTVGTVTSGDVSAILPAGTLSSSAQIDGSQVTGVVSSSYSTTSSFAISASWAPGGSGGAVATYTNGTDNYIITSTGADSINGESNLQFDGTALTITGNVTASGGYTGSFYGDGSGLTGVSATADTASYFDGYVNFPEGLVVTGSVYVDGSVTSSGTYSGSFVGDGSGLSGITTTITSSLIYVIDGGGSAITTGIKGDLQIPFGCTITEVSMLADQAGSIVVDIWKDTYANYPPTDVDSITASATPTISSATKSTDSTLTGWTTSITAGDTLRFNVDSVSTITRVTISLKVTR